MIDRSQENLVFIGLTSTGKSTTAKGVADRLGMAFIDLDDVVETLHVAERGHPRRCREIVSLFGRECFIDYERRGLKSLSGRKGTVIATGGGTPMDAESRRMIHLLGRVIYLTSPPKVIYQRMEAKGFPYYLGPNPSVEALDEVWNARHGVYADLADLMIDNTTLGPEETVQAVIDQLASRDSFMPHSAESP
jgi:shikimate kinase